MKFGGMRIAQVLLSQSVAVVEATHCAEEGGQVRASRCCEMGSRSGL
jgi:hypothetical protein